MPKQRDQLLMNILLPRGGVRARRAEACGCFKGKQGRSHEYIRGRSNLHSARRRLKSKMRVKKREKKNNTDMRFEMR